MNNCGGNNSNNSRGNNKCRNCGQNWSSNHKQNCPATICKKRNHCGTENSFAKVCFKHVIECRTNATSRQVNSVKNETESEQIVNNIENTVKIMRPISDHRKIIASIFLMNTET